MADRKLKLDLEIAAKQAQKDLKDTAVDAAKLGTTFDETKSKGQAIADAMKATADQIETELAQAELAAEALGSALGDEMKAKFDQAGSGVDEMVGKLRNAGLTYDEIRADADQLADAIRRVDEVGSKLDSVGGRARTLSGDFDRVQTSGAGARSVMANMAGNAAQDLGALGGVAGSAGVAIGQMAEYTADGNIQLSQMGKLAGGIGLVAVVVEGVKMQMQQVAKIKAWDREQVDGYVDAIRDGESAIDALRSKLEDTGKVEFSLMGDVRDATPFLVELGVTAADFTKIVEGGFPAIMAWSQALIEAGADATSVREAAFGMGEQVLFLAEAQKNAAVTSEFLRDKTLEGREAHLEAQAAQRDHERKTRDLNAAYDDLGGATKDQIDAEREHFESLAAVDGKYDDVHASVKDVEAATRELDETYSRLTGKFNDREAWLNLSKSMDDFKAKMAAGELSTGEQELAIIDLAREMGEYVTELDNVPAEKKTEILALLEDGKIAEAEAEINKLARPRTVTISLGPIGGLGNNVGLTGIRVGASGGVVTKPTLAVIGEAGPEAVLPLSGAPGASPLPNGLGGRGDTINVYALRMDGREVDRVLAKQNRRNGR